MSYADDAIVSFARLDLQDSDVPAVCSEHEVQVTGNEFIVLPDVHVTFASFEKSVVPFASAEANASSAPVITPV